MSKKDVYDVEYFTDFFLCIYTIFMLIFAFIGIGYLTFAEFKLENFALCGALLISVGVVFGVAWILRILTDYFHDKNETGKLERFRKEVLIGYGGIALSAIIPRIVVFFVEYSPHTVYYGLIMIPMSSFFFHFLFINGVEKHCILDTREHGQLIVATLITNLMAFLATMQIGSTQYTIEKQKIMIVFCQMGYTILTGASVIQFLCILTGALKLKPEKSSGSADQQSNEVKAIDQVMEKKKNK